MISDKCLGLVDDFFVSTARLSLHGMKQGPNAVISVVFVGAALYLESL